jgi:DNA-directed RNA polymerase subunit RPC12/RpoP
MSDDDGNGDGDVLWSMTCNACDHEWMQTTPAGSKPSDEEVECPECGSSMLDAAYVGKL